MSRKREQYIVRQVSFKKVKREFGKLVFGDSDFKDFKVSGNFLYFKLYQILGRDYISDNENRMDELFILKANGLKNNKNNKELYKQIMSEGVYLNGVQYIRAEKSSNMTRTQKTLFIRADLQEKLEEHITLNRIPKNTIVSKYISARGLMLSSAYLMPGLPKICIIEDFKRLTKEDVNMVIPYEPKESEKEEYEQYKQEKELWNKTWEEHNKKQEETKDKFTHDFIKKNLKLVSGNGYKSKSKWFQESYRRVKIDQLDEPGGYKINPYSGEPYLVYDFDQTEEIKVFPLKPYTIGYEKVLVKDYEHKVESFDGEGLMSFEFSQRVSDFLEVKETNAIVGRLPYVKGLIVKFDFKKYLKEVLKTTTIKDIWGATHNVDEIDIIITASCFKAQLDVINIDGVEKKKWLFDGMEDYYNALNQYGYTHFGIANYAKELHKMPKYTPTTYQLLNTLNLTANEIRNLATETYDVVKSVLQRGDVASVKMFLHMIGDCLESDDEEDMTKADYYKKAIETNGRMIFDKEVQAYLYNECRELMENMLIGRILVPSSYRYITGDVIAFCEWAATRDESKVKGFLSNNEFYCNDISFSQEMVLSRYPVTHFSEIKIAPFVKNENSYIKHLDNIIQFNTYDNSLPRINGDFDGDKVQAFSADMVVNPKTNKTLKDAVVKDHIILNPGDKATVNAKEWNLENIIEFELKNIEDLTGVVTNICTTFEDIALSEGDIRVRDLEISVGKYLQGEIIDSIKKGNVVEIPSVLKQHTIKQPYYFRFMYGGLKEDYRPANSPLARFTELVSKKINKMFPSDSKEKKEIRVEETSYLDIKDIYKLMMIDENDETKADATYLRLIKELSEVYNIFSGERRKISNLNNQFSEHDTSDEAKEWRKEIRNRYSVLYSQARERCIEIVNLMYQPSEEIIEMETEIKNRMATLTDEKERDGLKKKLANICYNPSVLASACVTLGYELSKQSSNKHKVVRTRSYNFPWVICPEGIIINIEANTFDNEKTQIKEIKSKQPLQPFVGINELMNVSEGMGMLKSLGIQIPIEGLPDGKYPVRSHLDGKLYIEIIQQIEKKELACSQTEKEMMEICDGQSVLNKIKPLKDYKCRLNYLGGKNGNEVKELIDNQVVSLDLKDGQYWSLYRDGEFVASIRKEDWKDINNEIMLKDYRGAAFNVEVQRVTGTGKSMDIILNQVS